MNSELRMANGELWPAERRTRAFAHSAPVLHSQFSILNSLFLPLCLSLVWAHQAVGQAGDPKPQDQEQEDLSERLIRQAVGEEAVGLMGTIMNLMSQAAGSLKGDFDPGEHTQNVQRQIIEKMDEAIAAAQRRRSRSSSQPQQTSDKRRAEQQADQQREDQQSGDATTPSDQAAAGREPDRAKQSTAAGRLREFRRGWGNLPQRDRDEVLQGIDEDSLEKYRRQIESYFRALAEDREE